MKKATRPRRSTSSAASPWPTASAPTSWSSPTARGSAGTKLDPEFLSRFEKVAQLPEEKKNGVLLLLDPVIAKHTIRKVMGT